MTDNDKDQSIESTDDRWWQYKQQCRTLGVEPMSWGAWLQAGQPLGK